MLKIIDHEIIIVLQLLLQVVADGIALITRISDDELLNEVLQK
jgi:hypothetical protein